ncbi:MAG TPA: MlaD family protein [Mycobacteriales bacterium]|nr:MlaD family protein [Mycobacteriales bacterium]
MISRSTKLQLLVFAVVALVGLTFAGARYANLGRFVPGYDKGFLVSADFTDSGGVFVGSQVTNRGVAVGTVEKLTLLPEGVRVGMRLRPGSRVPFPTKAQVGNRSAIGEQYVDLLPQSDGPNVLHDGDVIPMSATSIPIQPTQLVVNLDRLVRSIDLADVGIVLDELAKGFEGSGDDLQRLIDAGDRLTRAATEHLPQTLDLIKDSGPVLQTQREVAGAFRSYNADLAQLSAQLRASDPDFRKLFRTGTDAARTTTALLEANRANLPVLLGNLVFLAQVQKVRIPALRQILVLYPNVVAGGFTVTPGDGTAHFGFVTSQSPQVCPMTDPGYATTKKRDPSDVTPRNSNFNAYCSLKSPSPIDVRGARNAPRAENLPPFPQDTGAGQSPQVRGAGGGALAEWQSVLADYDPGSGHAITSDGRRYTLGSTMGAARVFGASAWELLLMEPLRRS